MERKKKEIGVRKILGASMSNVIVMLSREYLKLVISAMFIAFPLGGYLLAKWLQGFPYQARINIWIFVIPGLASIAIALISICHQSFRAASAKPVDSLRME